MSSRLTMIALACACAAAPAHAATYTFDFLRDGQAVGGGRFSIDLTDPRFGQPFSAIGPTRAFYLVTDLEVVLDPGATPENPFLNTGRTFGLGDNLFNEVFAFIPDSLPAFPGAAFIELFDVAAGDGIFTWTFGTNFTDRFFLNGVQWGYDEIDPMTGAPTGTTFVREMSPPTLIPTPTSAALAALGLLAIHARRRR